ncbi:MAG: hypothetical protein IJ407_04710 [Clostridia bacterium]|nr:hypothetical protein [Clostridia bacterium]
MKYTLLPWMNVLSAGRIIPAVGGLLIAWCIFAALFRKLNASVRRGHFAVIDNTLWPLLLNTVIFTVAFWNWAFPIAIGVSLLFLFVIRNELKRSLEDERIGMFGMNAEMKRLRGEAYNDLSIEEQMAYKEKVTPIRFYWWIWLPLVVLLPFLLMLLLEAFGVGDYLFRIVYFE